MILRMLVLLISISYFCIDDLTRRYETPLLRTRVSSDYPVSVSIFIIIFLLSLLLIIISKIYYLRKSYYISISLLLTSLSLFIYSNNDSTKSIALVLFIEILLSRRKSDFKITSLSFLLSFIRVSTISFAFILYRISRLSKTISLFKGARLLSSFTISFTNFSSFIFLEIIILDYITIILFVK